MAKGLKWESIKANDKGTMGYVDYAWTDTGVLLRVNLTDVTLETKNGAGMYGAAYTTHKHPTLDKSVRFNCQFYEAISQSARKDAEIADLKAELEAMKAKLAQ